MKRNGKTFLRVAQLPIPIVNAQKILLRLKSKYKSLQAKLVLASQHGLMDVDSDGIKILDKIPSIFVTSNERKELILLFQTYKNLEQRNAEIKSAFIKDSITHYKQRVHKILETIEIVESTQINLVFDQLDYDLIERLQKDPLVDQSLTPQMRSSIKICLGTLYSLSRYREPLQNFKQPCNERVSEPAPLPPPTV